jgi:hypothetical protein
MRLLRVAVLLAPLLLSATAAGADREWITYARLLEITRLDRFQAVPPAERDKVRIVGMVTPKNPAIAPGSLVFTVVRGNERKRIPVNPDGSFDPAIDPAWIRDNPQVLTSMPEGEKAGFSFAALPVLPPGTRFDYAALMASVRQSNALVKSHAGWLRFMMPTFAGLSLVYPAGQAASATIHTAQGQHTVSADAQGVLRLPLDEALMRSHAQVSLSQRPQSADFLVD